MGPHDGATRRRRLRALAPPPLAAGEPVADHACLAEFSATPRAWPGAPGDPAGPPERAADAVIASRSRHLRRAWRRVLALVALQLGVLAAACLAAVRSCWPRCGRASTGARAGRARTQRTRRTGRIILALILMAVDATAATVRSLAGPARARPRCSRVTPHHSRSRGHTPPVRACDPHRLVSPPRPGRLHEPRRAVCGPGVLVRRLGRDDRAARADEAVGRLGGDGHEQTHLQSTVQRYFQRGARRPRRATGAQRTHHSTRAPPHPAPDAHSGFRARLDREG